MTLLSARIRLRYRYPAILLRAMVATDFKLRYQASLLGYLWTLLKPLAVFTILYLVFVKMLKFGITDYPGVYLLFGIIVWGFFAEATGLGLGSLVARADLLRKISFPRYVVVLSVGAYALITFGLSMIVLAVFLVVARVPLTRNVVWLPLLFVELSALSLSMAFFLSALFVRFRDLSYIWEVVLQAAFYATPIIYPLSPWYPRAMGRTALCSTRWPRSSRTRATAWSRTRRSPYRSCTARPGRGPSPWDHARRGAGRHVGGVLPPPVAIAFAEEA